MNRRTSFVLSLLVGVPLLIAACAGSGPTASPETSPAPSVSWTETVLDTLTTQEKIGQLFVIRVTGRFQNAGHPRFERAIDLVETFHLGGIIFGLGTPMAQTDRANVLQKHAALPLLMSQDMEWGAGMRIDRSTTLPPAMAVGATRVPEFARLAGRVTGREARALGVHQVYAPVADVNNNPENPIINVRSYGERPDLVAGMTSRFVRGIESAGALATLKHFPGHGDTDTDSHLALPVLRIDRARLDSLELVPFRAALDAEASSVMTGHLALPALEPDSTVPATLSPPITTGLLRDEMGFDGLIVTDALDMQGVTRGFGTGEAAVRAFEAGADVLLMSEDPRLARDALLRALDSGRITEAQIDRSVRRILETKERLGLHRSRTVDPATTRRTVAARRSQVLGDVIARRSLTLLRNDSSLVPMMPPQKHRVLAVTLNDRDDPDVGSTFLRTLRSGGAVESMTVRRLHTGSDSTDYREVLDAASKHDRVVVGSFLRVSAYSGRIGLPERHGVFLDRLLQRDTPALLTSFGNPYVTGSLDALPPAVLTAYGTNRSSQTAAAQALIGQSGTPGRLPITIPDQFDYGAGQPLPQQAPRADVPEAVGMEEKRLRRVDSLLHTKVVERAFPGAAVAVGRGQTIAKLDGIGYHTFDAKRTATPQSRYDLASLTKVVATTTAVMTLYERGDIELDAPVVRYLPDFGQNGKDEVTVRQLLLHASGLKPYLGPEERGPSPQAIVDTIMAQDLQYEPGTESRYSGLNMITLMQIVEAQSGQDFETFCEEEIFDPLGMDDTGFRSVDTQDSRSVPTTDTTGTLYQGSVHDPMARDMGGVSANAGLFSTAEDLAHFASMLVNDGRIYGRPFLQPETIETFTTRGDVPNSTRALGWDTKSVEGYSSAGSAFSASSFGHTGYTGTSFWIDPEQDLFAILLTNRVYPDDTDGRITEIRPIFADLVHRSIVAPPAPLLPE